MTKSPGHSSKYVINNIIFYWCGTIPHHQREMCSAKNDKYHSMLLNGAFPKCVESWGSQC